MLEKLIRTKEQWAREGRGLTGETSDPTERRLPPGQRLVKDWPVLDLGTRPNPSKADWRLTIGGRIAKQATIGSRTLVGLPTTQPISDIHCVTQWSRYDNHWKGVPGSILAALVRPRPEATFVILKSFDGYTTTIPLSDFTAPGVILATHWEGEPLTREHGGPVRMVVPQLYFWKSAKWIRRIWFTDADAPGFWESRGHHPRGNPWREERYGGVTLSSAPRKSVWERSRPRR